MNRYRFFASLALASAVAAPSAAADWQYNSTISVPRPYAPLFAAMTPTGDCVFTTFNNSNRPKVDLPVVLIHNPLSDSRTYHLVCMNSFPALRGYSGVAVDSQNNYYVAADTGETDSWIRKFRPDGTLDPQFGNGGEIKPGRRVLGLDLADKYLFTTYGFGELAVYELGTGRLVGIGPKPASPVYIRDVAVDPARQVIYGVAQGAAWAWEGGKFSNPSSYKLRRLSPDTLAEPKAGEGTFFDAFGRRNLIPVAKQNMLLAVDDGGKEEKSPILGAAQNVRNLSDAVLLADGQTLFITDTTANAGGVCGIHVMKRAGADAGAVPAADEALPLVAAAMTPATGNAPPPGMNPPPAAPPAGGTGGVNWVRDVNAAFDEAKRTGKPVVVYARTAASKRCEEAEKGVLASGDFSAAAVPYIAVWFDIATDPKLSQQLGIFRVPTISVYKPSGDRAGMLQGKLDQGEVLAELKTGAAAK